MEPILGIHESALLFRTRRMEVLSANLANADTPNFKARDMAFTGSDFDAAMRAADGASRMRTTNAAHLRGTRTGSGAPLQYRLPHQPSLDGNTVETDLELARFAENSVSYQASLLFINGRISSLRAAISGGR